MGLCRQSVHSHERHMKNRNAAQSLFNFETLIELLLYVTTLFPELEDDVHCLKQIGSFLFTNSSKLTHLEQCIICCTSLKVNVTNE